MGQAYVITVTYFEISPKQHIAQTEGRTDGLMGRYIVKQIKRSCNSYMLGIWI